MAGMTDSVVDPAYALRTRKNATAWQAFVVLIAAVMILPMMFVPFSRHVMTDADSTIGALIVLSFIAAGTGSGPLSVWERRTRAAAAVAGILGFFSLARIGLGDLAP